jgi:hypothetical protein
MALNSIFIPKKIRAGFVKREGTYTGKLAYVIYYDTKGELRKEKSWNSWRDTKIAPETFDNTPQGGFVLNKNVERYQWSHFGSGRSYIRMYDPRGIEFEITPENLIGILMNTTISKRGLDGEFVYAWHGDRLMLLPTNSEEYQKAVEYTDLQGQKVGAKELKLGVSYTTKKGEEVIYIGRFNWWTWHTYDSYGGTKGGRTAKKRHIFYDVKNKSFLPKPDADFLANANSPDPVLNYAELVEKFQANIHSSATLKFEAKPAKVDLTIKRPHHWAAMDKQHYSFNSDDAIVFYTIQPVEKYDPTGKERVVEGYRIEETSTLDKKTLTTTHHSRSYSYHDVKPISEEDARKRLERFHDVQIVLESGKKIPLKYINDLNDR